MARNATGWRLPYKDWSLADLLISNQLRPAPLPYAQLTLFTGARSKSLQEAKRRLRRENVIRPDDTLNLDHPLVEGLRGTPKLQPLPDPGPASLTEAADLAASLPPNAVETPGNKLDIHGVGRILENYITGGQGGPRDTPRLVETWIDVMNQAPSAGPPPPQTPSEIAQRICALLSALPAQLVRNGIALWEQSLPNDADPDRPPGPLPEPPDLVDRDPALGASGPHPPRPEPSPPGPGPAPQDPHR